MAGDGVARGYFLEPWHLVDAAVFTQGAAGVERAA